MQLVGVPHLLDRFRADLLPEALGAQFSHMCPRVTFWLIAGVFQGLQAGGFNSPADVQIEVRNVQSP